jgi:hypothetical protein
MPVGCLRVAVGLLAMVMGGVGVLLSLVMLAGFVVVSRLVVMVGRSRVPSCRLVMVLG